MTVLIILAHPLEGSFAASVAATVEEAARTAGRQTHVVDLYASGFDPRLSPAERAGYFDTSYDASSVADLVARLEEAEAVALVFPQWWFSPPAIMKGFIDRVFAPGTAFWMNPATKRIEPRLDRLRHFWVFTSTGSPWWVARLYMGDPVRRILKRGVARFCAPRARFRMLTMHDMDHANADRCSRFLGRVARFVSSSLALPRT